ncbi:MAG: hypothetical protein LBL93_06270 [Ruminococcus sp.]|nr:hypothetical protein [Ruminococcus sp.]
MLTNGYLFKSINGGKSCNFTFISSNGEKVATSHLSAVTAKKLQLHTYQFTIRI